MGSKMLAIRFFKSGTSFFPATVGYPILMDRPLDIDTFEDIQSGAVPGKNARTPTGDAGKR
jgi:hypothetical protein